MKCKVFELHVIKPNQAHAGRAVLRDQDGFNMSYNSEVGGVVVTYGSRRWLCSADNYTWADLGPEPAKQ